MTSLGGSMTSSPTYNSAIRRLSPLFAMMWMLSACELPRETTSNDLEVIEGTKQSDSIELIGEGCYREHYKQPESVRTDKLDILFVVDTSGSLSSERIQVAHRIDKFIKKLPSNVNYRISVLLSHGKRSHWAGNLYYRGILTPTVFDSNKHSLNWIRLNLKFRMTLTPMDYFSDGGETAFYSLYKASSGLDLAKHKKEGMFRDDAGLAVVFVSDENEICAQYPDNVTPTADHNFYNGRTLEDIAKEENCTVTDSNGDEQWLSPEFMLDHLKALKGNQPVSVGAIIHTDKNPNAYRPVPLRLGHNSKSGKSPKSRRLHSNDEDEYGYGYAELVELAHGEIIDIWGKDYSEGLEKLGTRVANQMRVYDTFQLTHSPTIESSIEAFVDGNLSAHTFNATNNTVGLANPGVSNSDVEIEYCVEAGDPPPVVDPPVVDPPEVPEVDPPEVPEIDPEVPEVDPELPEVDPENPDDNGDLPDTCTAIDCGGIEV